MRNFDEMVGAAAATEGAAGAAMVAAVCEGELFVAEGAVFRVAVWGPNCSDACAVVLLLCGAVDFVVFDGLEDVDHPRYFLGCRVGDDGKALLRREDLERVLLLRGVFDIEHARGDEWDCAVKVVFFLVLFAVDELVAEEEKVEALVFAAAHLGQRAHPEQYPGVAVEQGDLFAKLFLNVENLLAVFLFACCIGVCLFDRGLHALVADTLWGGARVEHHALGAACVAAESSAAAAVMSAANGGELRLAQGAVFARGVLLPDGRGESGVVGCSSCAASAGAFLFQLAGKLGDAVDPGLALGLRAGDDAERLFASDDLERELLLGVGGGVVGAARSLGSRSLLSLRWRWRL
eukprot:comp21455_c0_seq1/m.46594 comp21455_c0_seq1/g.46594  ORF comp21455_c0_seq1/g.46594 comp21455_c0_seq1/m.46594 type:complete len:349 (+) comp21455_c0_seq1:493-1539(+)